MFRIDKWSDAAIGIWESLLHRSLFLQGGRLSQVTQRFDSILAIFMPKIFQGHNTL